MKKLLHIIAAWLGLFALYALITYTWGEDGPQIFLIFIFPFAFLILCYKILSRSEKEK